MKHINVIVDLQFGSTGKGLLAGYLALEQQPDLIVTAWGPNAGHTFIDAAGRKFVNIALPNGLVARPKHILLGPGSVIDPDRLLHEMREYADLLHDVNILIHEHAAVVTEANRAEERSYGFAIGSTMKGVGEAMIRKIRRQQPHNIARVALAGTELGAHVVRSDTYAGLIRRSKSMLVEGAQGYSLGINSGFYPWVTSRECTVAQLMVDCAIPVGQFMDMNIIGSARTYPIRVANRFDADGNQIGTSGPPCPDQVEIRWDEIGQEPELTTVTKLPRRLFTWSNEQVMAAIEASEVDSVFLNFVNYMAEGKPRPLDQPDLGDIMSCCRMAGAPVKFVGHGPAVGNIVGA